MDPTKLYLCKFLWSNYNIEISNLQLKDIHEEDNHSARRLARENLITRMKFSFLLNSLISPRHKISPSPLNFSLRMCGGQFLSLRPKGKSGISFSSDIFQTVNRIKLCLWNQITAQSPL